MSVISQHPTRRSEVPRSTGDVRVVQTLALVLAAGLVALAVLMGA